MHLTALVGQVSELTLCPAPVLTAGPLTPLGQSLRPNPQPSLGSGLGTWSRGPEELDANSPCDGPPSSWAPSQIIPMAVLRENYDCAPMR